MLLGKLLEGCGAIGNYDADANVVSVCCNSEDVVKGSLFVALKGRRTNGAEYVRRALNRGAVCAVCEGEPWFEGFPIAVVSDARSACARIYSNFYENPDVEMKIVAVTGTNGKTTVASLLEHIYKWNGRKTGIIGTVHKKGGGVSFARNDDTMTTPDPAHLYKYLSQMKKEGCDTVVLEASSHALELSKLDGMHVDVGVFTNLTPEHLDFHGTMESYYRAKKRLADKAGLFIANYDDPFGRRLCSEKPSTLAVSADPENAGSRRVFATATEFRSRGFSGIEYIFRRGGLVFPVFCKMIGVTALYNTLVAAAAAFADGVTPMVISEALADFKGVSGRFEVVCEGKDRPLVIIDYAHTPDSFQKALVQTRSLMSDRSRLAVLFGCGGERDKGKRAVMGAAAEKYADLVIVTDDNPRGEDPAAIRRDILNGMKNKNCAKEIAGRREAICEAVCSVAPEDVILILGKGHEEYVIDKNGKRAFFEREIIKNAVLDRFGAV